MLRYLFVLSALIAVSLAVNCKYEGQELQNGEITVVKNAFRIKCITEDNGSWKTDIVGCVTPDGTSIDVGQQHEAGDKVHECVKTDAGQVSLKESKGKFATCSGGQKNGEEWQEKSFRFRCTDGGVIKFIACVGQDGTVINAGQTGKIGGFEVNCQQHPNGTITMQAANSPQSYTCKSKDGKEYQHGKEYIDGSFVRKCQDYGQGKIIGCYAPDVSDTIPINQNVTVGDIVYSCTKDGANYSFKTFSTKNEPSKVYALCAQDGKTYTNGTTFISQASFRMKCVTYENLTASLEVVSCITPAGVEIPIGTQVDEGDKLYECTLGNVSLKSTPGMNAKCKGVYSVGDEWVEDNSFKFMCQHYGKKTLLSCISSDGMEIPLGEARRVSAGYAMECVNDNGVVNLRAAKNFDCVTGSGEVKKFGETWNEGTFIRRCVNYGVSSIIGCFVENLGSIGLNQNLTSGNILYMCINENNQFNFRTAVVRST